MGLYGFKDRFVPLILSGAKTHTIRALRKDGRVDRPGKDICHCYERLRTKKARLLGRWPCVKVERIEIKDGIFGDENHASVIIDGQELDCSEREVLTVDDGFKNFEEMIQFWRGRLPFVGHVIHWNYRAGHAD